MFTSDRTLPSMVKYGTQLVLGGIFAGLSFPLILFERLFPYKPSEEALKWDDSRWWTHNVLNTWTEYIRADSQYWGKLLSFLIFLMTGITIWRP